VFDLVRGDEASFGYILILDVNHVGRHSLDPREKCFAAVVFEVDAGAGGRADFQAGFAAVAQPFVIFDVEPFVAAHRALPLLRGPPPLMGEAGDHKMVDA
jgi:hypothetical protein